MKLLFPVLFSLSLCAAEVQGEGLQTPKPPAVELTAEQRVAYGVAIKKVLLEQMVRARDERHRITTENYAACARLAQELGAPEPFVRAMQAEASGELTARERYELNSELRELYQLYRVDTLALRYFVEGAHVTAEELRLAAQWLPFNALFNLSRQSEQTEQKVAADASLRLLLLTELGEIYARIDNREQAFDALPRLLPLLVRYESVAATTDAAAENDRQHYTRQMQLLYPSFQAERTRLREHGYFNCRPLQIIDLLLR